jgi:hypothetical protein
VNRPEPASPIAWADLPGPSAWEPGRWESVPRGLRWDAIGTDADDRDDLEELLEELAELETFEDAA